MKVTIEVECTPDEARQFLGLPDVKPMQAAVMARVEKQMIEAADAFSPEAVLKNWLTLVPQGTEHMQDMFRSVFTAPFSGKRDPH